MHTGLLHITKRVKRSYPVLWSQIILLGTSGGAQVALGTVPYLNKWLDAQLIMVSVGGDFFGTTGFNTTEHVYHVQGRRD